ncbi:MAG: hypothetical protein II178_09435 [Selenomonadaceae bacterium]|nr:hypothetical protein [Selenomonadaceae bacterium]
MAALLQPLVPANALIATFCRSLRIAEVEECFPCNPVVRIYLNLSIISGTGSGAFCCGSKTPEDTETIGRFLVYYAQLHRIIGLYLRMVESG